ncbi:PI31 proteasome regulator N-terminal-domain-containing protein [Mycena rosella]|uniref:PI31 proteasome regulator N-terminal-domain-containing protein n=1 Tax=Mycena rosella TaxID=1033263 RepID=A0AAD7DUA0_MYCRO|nr:PI31 proteasome regulator N-terminal-domain-containing protein [Mycena rosella]
MVADALDAAAVIALLPTLLPTSKKTLSSSQDGIAALLHAAMTSLAFRLIAIDESSPGTSALPALPEEWNKHGPSHYTFRYRHDQSSLEFVVKVSKLGGRTLINAIALESDKASSLDIPTNDFVSSSFYPHDLSASDAMPLVHGFISSNRVADLMSQFKLKIVQKLVPGLRKEGYTEAEDVPTSSTANASATNSTPAPAQPRQPWQPPPVFPGETPYQLPPSFGPRNPLEIGRRDLDPFPANPFSPPLSSPALAAVTACTLAPITPSLAAVGGVPEAAKVPGAVTASSRLWARPLELDLIRLGLWALSQVAGASVVAEAVLAGGTLESPTTTNSCLLGWTTCSCRTEAVRW